jgi:hypothetical protein
MSINRVQIKTGGGGTYDATSVWTIDLNSTPTAGNTLLIYIYSVGALSISSITQGGSSAVWSLIQSSLVSNRNIYVYALEDIPVGSDTTITLTLGSAANNFCSTIEEISGLLNSSIFDVSATSSSTSVNQYNTGTTSVTTTGEEYWVNIYTSYNAFGIQALGTTPSNGYSLDPAANPISIFDSGWIGSGTGASPLYSAIMIISYKIVSSTGTAGGTINDANFTSSDYSAMALTFKGQEITPTENRRRVDLMWF